MLTLPQTVAWSNNGRARFSSGVGQLSAWEPQSDGSRDRFGAAVLANLDPVMVVNSATANLHLATAVEWSLQRRLDWPWEHMSKPCPRRRENLARLHWQGFACPGGQAGKLDRQTGKASGHQTWARRAAGNRSEHTLNLPKVIKVVRQTMTPAQPGYLGIFQCIFPSSHFCV